MIKLRIFLFTCFFSSLTLGLHTIRIVHKDIDTQHFMKEAAQYFIKKHNLTTENLDLCEKIGDEDIRHICVEYNNKLFSTKKLMKDFLIYPGPTIFMALFVSLLWQERLTLSLPLIFLLAATDRGNGFFFRYSVKGEKTTLKYLENFLENNKDKLKELVEKLLSEQQYGEKEELIKKDILNNNVQSIMRNYGHYIFLAAFIGATLISFDLNHLPASVTLMIVYKAIISISYDREIKEYNRKDSIFELKNNIKSIGDFIKKIENGENV